MSGLFLANVGPENNASFVGKYLKRLTLLTLARSVVE